MGVKYLYLFCRLMVQYSGYHFCFMFGSSWFVLSTELDILTKDFGGFPQSFQNYPAVSAIYTVCIPENSDK